MRLGPLTESVGLYDGAAQADGSAIDFFITIRVGTAVLGRLRAYQPAYSLAPFFGLLFPRQVVEGVAVRETEMEKLPPLFLIPRQEGETSRRVVDTVRSERRVSRVAVAEEPERRGRAFVHEGSIEPHAQVPALAERIGQRAFHESDVLAAGQLFQRERLLEVSDGEVADHRELLDLDVGVLERVGAGEVVLEFVLDVPVHAAFHEQARAPELRTVADAAELAAKLLVRTVDRPVVLHPSADLQLELAVCGVEPQPALPIRGQEVLLADLLFDVRDLLRQFRCSVVLLLFGHRLDHQVAVLLFADLAVGLQDVQNFRGHVLRVCRRRRAESQGDDAGAQRCSYAFRSHLRSYSF